MHNVNHHGDARPWIELQRDRAYERFGRGIDEVTYRLPTGQEALFVVHTQRPSVAVLGLTSEYLVIVTRQFRPGPGTFVYELPGGYLDGNDDDPVDAGARELLEETGFASAAMDLVGSCYADSYSRGRKYCVLATDCIQVGHQNLDPEEFVDILLVAPSELRELIKGGMLMDVDLVYLGLDAAGLL